MSKDTIEIAYEKLAEWWDSGNEDKAEFDDVIQALRDAIEAPLLEQIAMLRDFAKDVADNYDCDSDAHKYGSRCRSCEAKNVLTATEATATAYMNKRLNEEAQECIELCKQFYTIEGDAQECVVAIRARIENRKGEE